MKIDDERQRLSEKGLNSRKKEWKRRQKMWKKDEMKSENSERWKIFIFWKNDESCVLFERERVKPVLIALRPKQKRVVLLSFDRL